MMMPSRIRIAGHGGGNVGRDPAAQRACAMPATSSWPLGICVRRRKSSGAGLCCPRRCSMFCCRVCQLLVRPGVGRSSSGFDPPIGTPFDPVENFSARWTSPVAVLAVAAFRALWLGVNYIATLPRPQGGGGDAAESGESLPMGVSVRVQREEYSQYTTNFPETG